MNPLLALLGLALLAVMLVDVVATAVAIDGGAGPLTGRLTRSTWNGVLRVAAPGHQRMLRSAGLALSVSPIAIWILLAWAGWALLFLSSESSVVAAATGAPAGAVAKVYFVGYTLFTLGLGDFEPRGGLWQILTTLTVGSGLMLVTLSISFLVPVTSAAASTRQIASYISSLGTSPDDIVRHGWNGRDFRGLSGHLVALTPMMTALAERHLTYPVVHYMHATERHKALAPAIATLDEALGVLEHGVPSDQRPERAELMTLRRAIWEYLETLDTTFLEPASQAPETPSLAALREAGIPVVSDDEFAEATRHTERRRRLLLALVTDGGYVWDDVYAPETPVHLEASASVKEAG